MSIDVKNAGQDNPLQQMGETGLVIEEIRERSGGSDRLPTNDLNTASTVNPLSQYKSSIKATLAPISAAGFVLSTFVLCIISGFILFLIIFIIVQEINSSKSLNAAQIVPKNTIVDSTLFKNKMRVIKLHQEERQNSQTFIIQLTQMVLLNLLLPILTAILGYIFGTKEMKDRN